MTWWQLTILVWGGIIVFAGTFVATVGALLTLREKHDGPRRDR